MFIATWENASAPVCDAVTHSLASISTSDQAFRDLNVGLIVVFLIVVWFVLLPAVWWYQEEPNFQKVRPFWMSVFVALTGTIFTLSLILRMALPETYPCALVVIGFIVTAQNLASIWVVRGLIFIVENKIQQMMKGSRRMLLEEETQEMTPPTRSAIAAILLAGLNIGDQSKLALPDLLQVRRRGFLVLVIGLFECFGILGAIILFAVHPALLLCRGCVPYSELVIVVIVLTVPAASIILRIVQVGYKLGFANNSTGVVDEVAGYAITAIPLVLLGCLLEIIDPGNVDATNKFAWEWLFYIAGWLISIYSSVIPAYKAFRRRRHFVAANPALARSLLDTLKKEDGLSKDFENYAARHLVLELVNFLKDIQTFKKFFREKGDSWRKQKARLLYKMYIDVGAEAQVNISESERRQIEIILQRADSGEASASELQAIFDVAEAEVTKMLEHGIWVRFLRNVKRRETRLPEEDSGIIQVAPL